MDEFAYYTPAAKAGVLLIRSLSDEDVLEAARSDSSAAYQQIRSQMSENTNPSWITAQAAEEAYRRRLIDEIEFDYLSR